MDTHTKVTLGTTVHSHSPLIMCLHLVLVYRLNNISNFNDLKQNLCKHK